MQMTSESASNFQTEAEWVSQRNDRTNTILYCFDICKVALQYHGISYWLNQLTGVVCLKCKENSQFRKLSWVHMLLIYSCCNKNGAVCHRNDHYIPLWSLLNTLVPSHGWVFFMWYQQWQRMVERGEMFH